MTPIAENHIIITRKLFNEGCAASKNQNYGKTIAKLLFTLFVFCTIAVIWMIRTGGNLIYLAGEFIFIVALLFWMIFIFPATRNRSRYRSMCRASSDSPARIVRFFQDHVLVISEAGKKVSISYEDVLELKETKNLWILNCKNKQGILLKKDGFSFGNIEVIRTAIKQLYS